MSFVDLVTLTSHRRHELEARIHDFEAKCDRAINDLKNMKRKANGFINHLNCDPMELKERFLSVMQKLDEYMYLVTDMNLALALTAESPDADSPVQDLSIQTNFPASLSPFNIMDALTEPRPTTSHICPNLCPQPGPVKTSVKGEPKLIVFSGSSSAESVPSKSEKEVQCEMVATAARLTIEDPKPTASMSLAPSPNADNYIKDCCISAAQTLLEVDHEYPATIMNVEGGNLSVITEDPAEVTSFLSEMTSYYENEHSALTPAEIAEMSYCAYSVDGFYYRAMFLHKPKEGEKTVSVYVVDTGEIQSAPLESLRPLHKKFCSRPPYARFCHLAGIDLTEGLKNSSLLQKQEAFLKNYCNLQCTIVVDDNSSETLGVYVVLPSGTTLNDLLVEKNLAVPLEKPSRFLKQEDVAPSPARREPPSKPRAVNKGASHGPPPSDDEWSYSNGDIMQCPEYEDPVVAVTGYHNRDEADICQHYKGPPEKTCFKGARCTKKHILHHPDGWTLDQVPILAKCESLPLPAPGTCVKVLVTAVCHFDRVFVQLVREEEEEEIPEFGYVFPPKTLTALRRDMNSPATIQAYKRLTISPAPGELVAALYTDKWWYRARVLTVTRADQCVEVIFIDYGTVLWVKEDQIRALEPRFLSLPIQAIQCMLAGVLQSTDSKLWARAKRALADMVLDREVLAHVIASELEEIIVELITYEEGEEAMRGASVAERLADLGLVALGEYSVAYDAGVTQKQVVP